MMSEPLGDDWGEIVVGENGMVLATSKVSYYTEPSYGGGEKWHVGMIEQITPEGNRAAFPQFYPPTGPCGWVWDGSMQEWYYNGDCDQAVISITSVAARGSDTIVTLSDGRVFGPEPLGQLHLSYLVPALDGTYLGAGGADGLINIALTSSEPVSLFGSAWPEGAGTALNAFVANPPSAMKLLGDAARRQEGLSMFRDALEQDRNATPGTASLLSVDNDGFLLVGDVRQFKSRGSVANRIGDLVNAGRIIEFGLTTRDLSGLGGARTVPPGETAGREPSNSGPNVPQILMNLVQVANFNMTLCCGLGSERRFGGQKENPKWNVRAIFFQTPDSRIHAPIALWHELGHAWGAIHGRSIRAGQTNEEAWDWENFMRVILYGPLGPNNAPRIAEW